MHQCLPPRLHTGTVKSVNTPTHTVQQLETGTHVSLWTLLQPLRGQPRLQCLHCRACPAQRLRSPGAEAVVHLEYQGTLKKTDAQTRCRERHTTRTRRERTHRYCSLSQSLTSFPRGRSFWESHDVEEGPRAHQRCHRLTRVSVLCRAQAPETCAQPATRGAHRRRQHVLS